MAGMALLQHPGPPASSSRSGPGPSAAASLWLRWLSSEFEALAARRRVGISGWNSSTCSRVRGKRERGPSQILSGNTTQQFHQGQFVQVDQEDEQDDRAEYASSPNAEPCMGHWPQHQKLQVFQMLPVLKLASYISIPGSK